MPHNSGTLFSLRLGPLQIQLQQRRQQIIIAHGRVSAVGGEDGFVELGVGLLEPFGLGVVEIGERSLGNSLVTPESAGTRRTLLARCHFVVCLKNHLTLTAGLPQELLRPAIILRNQTGVGEGRKDVLNVVALDAIEVEIGGVELRP